MSQTYPPAPGHRFPYDLDGTIMKQMRSADDIEVDWNSNRTILNGEAGNTSVAASNAVGAAYWLVFMFPDLRNIDGLYAQTDISGYSLGNFDYSTDTTDGKNGNWTAEMTSGQWNTADTAKNDRWRSQIKDSLALTGVRAVRFAFQRNSNNQNTMRWRLIHFYGGIVAGENPNRLRFWHPTLDQEVDPDHFDIGDVVQGTSVARQFRIKNNSETDTAETINLSTQSLTDDMATGMELSANGTDWSSTLAIADLDPEAISGVLHVRRNMPADATLIPRAARIRAVADVWT
jgi:hypothetical protein